MRHPDFSLAKRMALAGYGWEDLVKKAGITEHDARVMVFGKRIAHKMMTKRLMLA